MVPDLYVNSSLQLESLFNCESRTINMVNTSDRDEDLLLR